MRNLNELLRAKKALAAERTALRKLESSISSPAFRKALSLITERGGSLIITGVGKSGFIGMKIAATFTSLGRRALYLHPVEALHGDLGIVSSHDVVIALSFSGNTAEVLRLCRYIKKVYGAPIIAMTGNSRSALSALADVTLSVAVKEEGSPHNLAPMASTTAMLVLGDVLAAALTSPKTFERRHFAQLHPSGSLGLELRTVQKIMSRIPAVPTVKAEAPLREAIAEITKKRFGIVGVCDVRGRLIGVITDGDIRRYVLKHGTVIGVKARVAMTRKPKTIAGEASLKDALVHMEDRKITTLFVLDTKKRPVGIIHMHMILGENLL